MARSGRESGWVKILKQIQTPLGFFVLALLIIESTLCIVLTVAHVEESHKWEGFLCMIAVFAAVLATVTCLTIWYPKNLLYSKDEHLMPQIEPSALRDQMEDIIAQRVKPDCLKTDA